MGIIALNSMLIFQMINKDLIKLKIWYREWTSREEKRDLDNRNSRKRLNHT